MVEKAKILPPQAQIGPITPEERAALMRRSLVAGVYEKEVDRESAFEILQARINSQAQVLQQQKEQEAYAKEQAERAKAEARIERENSKSAGTDVFGSLTKAVGRSVTSQIGGQIGRALVRGLLGGLLGGKGKKSLF